MKKGVFSVLALAVICMFFFSACQKEGETFRLTTQEYKGAKDSKAYISNNYACWSDGDQVKVNATTSSVSLSISNSTYQATISDIPTATDFYAIYPASYCASTFTDGATITLPSQITYSESQGNQLLCAPMAAKSDANNVLRFTNLCTLLKVHVASASNIVTAIRIEALTSNVYLSGSATVSFASDGTPSLGAITSGNNYVELNCGSGVSVANGMDFYIPIPSLAANTQLRITVTDKFSQNYQKTITASSTVPANIIVGVTGPTVLNNNDYDFYDYIWSQESGYIDLGIKPDNTCKLELTYAVTSTNTTQYLTGSRSGTGIQWFSLGGPSSQNYFQIRFCDSLAVNSVANNGWIRETGKKYRASMEVQEGQTGYYRGRCIFENITDNKSNELYTGYVYGGIPSAAPNIYLFALNDQSSQRHKGLKCYNYRLWKDTNSDGTLDLIADFVPVQRKSDNVVGVYNMATGNFIQPTQVGSTAFSVGKD